MAEYIEKTAVESGIFVAIIDKANNEQTIKEIIDDLPTADVIERAKVPRPNQTIQR